ncbi:MAG: hypothetical protein JRH20_03785 [Deltaproteobacteria bacterium]|nr:hypothetical protein [Deltaproteobacteria bacterium]
MSGSQDTLRLGALADTVFKRLSPYPGEGLRNHCLRLHRLTEMLLARQNLILRPGLGYLIAMLHDLGLVADVPGETYLERSAALFVRVTGQVALSVREQQVAEEALLFNHRVRPVAGVSPEAECFRQAVWVEHWRGLRRFGLPKEACKQVFVDHPREDFDGVLLDFTRRVLVREPMTLWRGIFR